MPRLRNRNTVITDMSQISEGDCLVYRGIFRDIVGTPKILAGQMHLRLDQDGVGALFYIITNIRIANGQYIKISPQIFSELKSFAQKIVR